MDSFDFGSRSCGEFHGIGFEVCYECIELILRIRGGVWLHFSKKVKYQTMGGYGMSIITAAAVSYLIILHLPIHCNAIVRRENNFIPQGDADLLEFPLNLEYLEAEFFLYGSLGYGHFTSHNLCRAIKTTVKGFPRPLLDLSSASFAKVMDKAFGRQLKPHFDPYANGLNFLLASYLFLMLDSLAMLEQIQDLNLLSPRRYSNRTKRKLELYSILVAGLLGVESGQDAVIRALLYQRAAEKVEPYGVTVAEFTDRISDLRNKLGHAGIKDEGTVVPKNEGAEGKITGNVLAGDQDSLAYPRTPRRF
ncbi:hypothetical protein CSA_004588 [Cucumis sativus]|uniref:Uncharacterized protein n=1 Tax=Cucumis sativus TaxID=3659 RepID=A0ACB6HB24_CUCSA|nr:hypothetical protein CSA_004588 [Cucumis sativus]